MSYMGYTIKVHTHRKRATKQDNCGANRVELPYKTSVSKNSCTLSFTKIKAILCYRKRF